MDPTTGGMAVGRGLSFWKRCRGVFADAIGHFNVDDGWAMASNVALSAIMAVFPFLIFVAALAGFLGNAKLAQKAADLLFAAWPKEVAQPIAGEVHRVLTEPHGGLLTVSILVAIFLASNGVEAVRTALNRAYRVVEDRSLIWRRLQSVAFILIGAASTLVLAFLGVLGPLLFKKLTEYLPGLAPFSTSFTLASFGLTSLILIIALVAAHLWLPAGRPPALRLWPGVVLTLALWLVGTYLFGVYLRRFADYASTYAGLAGVFTAIFFLYLVGVAMIFGAEFNAALWRSRDPTSPGST